MAGGFRDRLIVSEGRFGRVLIGFMALGFVALIAAAIGIAWINNRNLEFARGVYHTQDVQREIAGVQVALEQSETARRGYIISGAPVTLDAYRRVARQLGPRLAALRRLTIDNPRQTARIDGMRTPLDRLDRLRTRSIALAHDGDFARALAEFRSDTSLLLMSAIRYRMQAMAREEAALLNIRSAQLSRATTLFFATSVATAVLLGLVALLSLVVVFRNTNELTQSRDTLRLLNDTLEDQVSIRTADLSRANEEIQRFAYIVSHDLRSPLVNVMGFTAELQAATAPLADLIDRAEAAAPDIVTEEARLAAREDLPEAIGFIRTSTQKMDRLINAILKLSREGRRVIAPEPIDLGAILDGIAGSMRHVIEDRGVTLTIEPPFPAVISDRLAVEQILSNLIENATKYSQPGRPGRITVTAGDHAGRVVVAVADNGRGIDPRDHQRVFDLFRRSGQQDQPGEGIGLAHVRALAYRLGGRIDLESTLGEGATFRLNLPKQFEPQDSKA